MIGKRNISFIILFYFFILSALRSQEINNIGVPFVQNYSKHFYHSGNQNWSICRSANGIIYFGNSDGLLVYDGKYWNNYPLPNKQIVRSVASDDKGKVYVGGFGEFGYWEYNRHGKFTYHSISAKLPEQNAPKEEIWKIYIDGNRVLFQSFATIYIYERGKIEEVKAEHPFLFLFKVNKRFFVEVIGKGLYELNGNKLDFIPSSTVLANTEVLSILPYDHDSYLIGTAKDGLFIYNGNAVIRWESDANDYLKTYQLNNGEVLMGKYFTFGTILNGLIIIDEEGRIIQKINKNSGLQNNTILSLYLDDEFNLWAGLDNGIDRIELSSPLNFYFDKAGDIGTVYSSIVYKDKIYIGTNQGLYYSDWAKGDSLSFRSFDFKFIDNSQGQVWDLSLIDGQLICGHNNGTYRVTGDKIEKISAIQGGWTIKRLPSHPDYLIQGTYIGLALFKKNKQGNWQFHNKIDNFGEPSKFVEQDNKGNLWISHAYRGIYRLKLDDLLTHVVSSKSYDESSGLPSTYNVNIFNLDNKIVFTSDSGFYYYDDLSDHFFRYVQLNKLLGSFSKSNRIIKAPDDKYWLVRQGRVALISIPEPGKIEIDSTSFHMLNGKLVKQYENISHISNSLFLISVDDGFAIYRDKEQKQSKKSLPKVVIRRIENTTDVPREISQTGDVKEPITLPYDQNSIKITFALPYFSQGEVNYQFMLEGFSSKWSDWSEASEKEFTNLNAGNYTFKVRARLNNAVVSEVSEIGFSIKSPWFLSKAAIVVYIVLSLLLALLLRKLYEIKLKKHQAEIEKNLEKEKEEYLRLEAIANEQKIVKLKNEQLQKDLASKNRELANSAMNIVYKNELLQKIRLALSELKDSHGKKLSEDQLKRINKVIEDGMSDERDWNLFERSFNEAHENFFKKLKGNYPQLVPNDLKLCAYLRMNMSSKEMASLLTITLRGVEIRRYRLRKKLNLEHDKNLVEFLMEL